MTEVPVPYQVVRRSQETTDTTTLVVEPVARALPPFRPGQFAMIYAFGVGEIPVSVSGILDHRHRLAHTVRAVGAVSAAVCAAAEGQELGLRGPFGTGWELERAAGGDVLVVAGGIGLAPLRPLIRAALAGAGRYRRLNLLAGARTPDDLLYADELRCLADAAPAHVAVTVDRPGHGWLGSVGMVTQLLNRADFAPGETTAFVCGPEAMIRATARDLRHRGVPADRIRVSLERNMRCATGHCGHCQLGPLLLCRDGPVAGYDRVAPLLAVREL
ncbi:oxidoreductase [Streptomyces sp. A7024]|uniref:Oxidoreductase n=1 Tax=Streptomyces coryli TaxID=1128680 RepID=A0A6G4TRJ0_9ACTN|nr:FAD/NAD(P)-binding protein [Streptomyces coryli]NGN62464.1 oxidoreductase [Streptomyces coryli]